MGAISKAWKLSAENLFGFVYVFLVTMILIGLAVGAFALIGL